MRSGRTLSYVLTLAALTGLYSCLAMVKEMSPYHTWGDTAPEFHAALSLIVGWLLVFRTNTAHARWWEARTLWGNLVNATRNLSMKISRLGSIPYQDMHRVKELIIDFPVALKLHLRAEPAAKQILEKMHAADTWSHTPLAIATELYAFIGTWKRNGHIDGEEMRALDIEALRLMDVCGGCERIQRTRIIRSYRVFARQCVMLFLVTLPWGIVEDFGWWTVPLTSLTAYFMLGMEIVAEHVEEPFGYDDDDLDLETLCITIQKSATEVFQSAVQN